MPVVVLAILVVIVLLAVASGPRRRARSAARETDAERLRLLVDHLPDAAWVRDAQGRLVGGNTRFRELTAIAGAGLVALEKADEQALSQGLPVEREALLPGRGDQPPRVLESRHARLLDRSGAVAGVLSVARDVTRARATEAHLRRLNRLHEVLSAAHAALSDEASPAAWFAATCRILVEAGGLRMAWVAQPDHATGALLPVARAGVTGDYLDEPHTTLAPGPLGDSPCATAWRTGQPAWTTDIATSPAMAPWASRALALGYRSSSAFPLKASGRVVAVLTVYSDMAEFFDEDELALLRRLSGDIGRALESRDRDLERAHAGQALAESEARFASMFKTSPTGMALCRFSDKAFLDVNEAFVALLGYAPAELARRGDGDPGLWIDVAQRDATWARLALDGEVHDVEARMRARDGRAIEVSFSASRIRVGSDDLLLTTLHDLTVQHEAQRTLEDRRHDLEELVGRRTSELTSILDAMPDLFFRLATDGTIVDFRAGRRNDLLLPPEEFLGRRIADVLPAEPAAIVMAGVAQATASHGQTLVEYPLMLPAGEQVFEARILPIAEDQLIAFVRNITDRKSLEADRERARQRAEELATAKSEFLANMSHEIRTPLNGLLGLAQLGLREARDGMTRHTFGAILDSGRLLLGIVDDVLDFSKLEVGKLRVEQQPVSPRAIAEDVVAMIRERAVSKEIGLSLAFATGLPRHVLGDPLRIQQVLVNLLSNAIKFTERGRVQVRVDLEPSQLPDRRARDDIVFSVSDTGVGIAPEHLQILFVAFQQADTSTTRRFGGTGLGLAISRRLAELMDGEIRVSSTLGQGSVFELRLPARSPDEAVAERSDADRAGETVRAALTGATLRGLRVLVAEDNEVNQLVLERALRMEGADVVVVGDGRQAVTRVVEEGGAAFHVVLMDIQMPEMDGHEATRRIRQLAPTLPIIGQTAHAMLDERMECLASGMVDHIAKPIEFARLVETVLRHARPAREADEATA